MFVYQINFKRNENVYEKINKTFACNEPSFSSLIVDVDQSINNMYSPKHKISCIHI